jgi:hypothetical protein
LGELSALREQMARMLNTFGQGGGWSDDVGIEIEARAGQSSVGSNPIPGQIGTADEQPSAARKDESVEDESVSGENTAGS